MTRIDENQEAIARIRMNIDASDAELRAQAEDIEEDHMKVQQTVQTAATSQGHWKLGAPEKHVTTIQVTTEFEGHPPFQGFHKNLFKFLQKVFPEERIDGSPLKVCNNLMIRSKQ